MSRPTIRQNNLDRIASRDGWRCRWCGARTGSLTGMVDKIVPKEDGGGKSFSNLVLACPTCFELRRALRVVLGPELFPLVRSPGGLQTMFRKIVAKNRPVDDEDPNQVHLFDGDEGP